MPVCILCGSETFDEHDGLYFCDKCGTQSQVNHLLYFFLYQITFHVVSVSHFVQSNSAYYCFPIVLTCATPCAKKKQRMQFCFCNDYHSYDLAEIELSTKGWQNQNFLKSKIFVLASKTLSM